MHSSSRKRAESDKQVKSKVNEEPEGQAKNEAHADRA